MGSGFESENCLLAFGGVAVALLVDARTEDVVGYEFSLDGDLGFESAADDYLIVIRHTTGFLAQLLHHSFEGLGGSEVLGGGPGTFGGG